MSRSIKILFLLLAFTSSMSMSGFPWNNLKPKVVTNRPGNLLYAKVYPLSSNGVKGNPFTAYLKPINDGSQAEYEIVNRTTTPAENEDTNNANHGGDVFQCSGVNCPKDATKCKIVESSNEPNHEIITTTVFCMNDENEILNEEKRKEKNPNEGSSINKSQTVSRNQNIFDFEDGGQSFNGDMFFGDMQKNMKNMFNGAGGGFFANNPFMPSMNMTGMFSG